MITIGSAIIVGFAASIAVDIFGVSRCFCTEPYDLTDFFTMPKFIGLDYDEVVEQYPDMNFNVIKEYSTEHEEGQITRQSYLAGRTVRIGQKIDIWVSLGEEPIMITTPDFVGMDYDEVIEKYPDVNFNVINKYSTEHEERQIIWQSVPARRVIRNTEQIDIWVNFSDINFDESGDDE